MKFTQLAVGKFRGKDYGGYTLFALGEDGKVYRSVHYAKGPAPKKGWVEMPDMILKEADILREANTEGQLAMAAGQL